MRVYTRIADVPVDRNSVVTMGTFDGVHLAHQRILSAVITQAKAKGGRSVLVTFEPHPRLVVKEKGPVGILTPLDEKQETLKLLGIDILVVVEFTKEFSQQDPEEFFRHYILEGIGLSHIVLGYDHRFGKGRGGDKEMLQQMGEENGFTVQTIDAVEIGDTVISSSVIRKALAEGDIALVNKCLGRSYRFRGTVIEGDKRGRRIGFPTANLEVAPTEKLLPAKGVYAVSVELGGVELGGVMNIGVRPTFNDEEEITVEVHLIDFSRTIYGEVLTVRLLERIRAEKKFDSVDALTARIQLDKEEAINILSK